MKYKYNLLWITLLFPLLVYFSPRTLTLEDVYILICFQIVLVVMCAMRLNDIGRK